MPGEKDHPTTFSLPVKADTFYGKCWWSDEVFPGSQQGFRDFVLISEFSELEGPVPLAIVSDTCYVDLKTEHDTHQQLEDLGLERFDFNAFALRVVSTDRGVDFQDKPDDIAYPPMLQQDANKGAFCIPDDTQVYFADSDLKFYAFTHHLTLFDINARGYVHPVALSYVTRDTDKIMTRFEFFMSRFNEVSRLMKKGNYANFILDLKYRLLDLKFTEESLQTDEQNQDNAASTPCTRAKLSPEAISQAETITTLMIDTMETSALPLQSATLDDTTAKTAAISPMDTIVPSAAPSDANTSTATSALIEPSANYQPSLIDSLYPVPHFERKLRSLSQLCHEPSCSPDAQPLTIAANATTAERISSPPPMPERGHRRSLPDTSLIPLASIIEPQRDVADASSYHLFRHHPNHDMYSEAIKCISDLTIELGRSTTALQVELQTDRNIDPIAQAVAFGRIVTLNMHNIHSTRQSSLASFGQDTTSMNLDATSMTSNRLGRDDPNPISMSHSPVSLHPPHEYEKPLPLSSQLWGKSSYSHLLSVIQKHRKYIHHIIYSLLTGRPVVIMGTDDNRGHIQQMVQALSVFVVGLSKQHHRIVPWFTAEQGLTDDDLATLKLVGVDKDRVQSSVYRLEISCLDISPDEPNLLTSPLYLDGQWIFDFLSKAAFYKTDEAYLAYLHTVFMQMSLRAYTYYHMFLDDDSGCDEDQSAYASYMSVSSSMVLDDPQPPQHVGMSTAGNLDEKSTNRMFSMRRIINYLKRIEQFDDYFDSNVDPSATMPSSAPAPATTANPQPLSSLSTTSSAPHPSMSLSATIGTTTPSRKPAMAISSSSGSNSTTTRTPPPPPMPPRPNLAHSDPVPLPQPPAPSTSTQSTRSHGTMSSDDNQITITIDNLHQKQPQHQHLALPLQQSSPQQPSIMEWDWTPPTASDAPPAAPIAPTAASAAPNVPNAASSNARDTSNSFSSTLDDGFFDQRRPSAAISEFSTYLTASSIDSQFFSALYDLDADEKRYWDEEDHIDAASTTSKPCLDDNLIAPARDHTQPRLKPTTSTTTTATTSAPVAKTSAAADLDDAHSLASERRGHAFLNHQLHVSGDDQTIVTYLASLVRPVE